MESTRAAGGRSGREPLSFSRVLTYSSPVLAVTFLSSLVSTYYVKYGTDVLLVAPGVMGLLYASSRVWEAICDPLVGFLSDRTRHRLGRRRTWILAAVIPLCMSSLMMWSPFAQLEGSWLLLWLLVGAFGFATGMSAFQIPHAALGAEISPESSDRARLFATNGVMLALGSFAALTVGLRTLRTAADPQAAATGLFAVAAVLVSVLCVGMGVRTREPASHQGRGASSPIRAYGDVWRNRHARILILVGLFVNVTYGAMGTVAVYMLQYVMRTPGSTELFMVSYFVPTLLSVPVWVMLTRRFEKRHLWMICLGTSALAYGSMGLVPEGVSLLTILPLAAVAGTAGGGFFVFEPAIRAEVIDFDECETGERKEGVYSASSQLVGKVAGAVMAAFVGMALGWSGYVPNLEQTATVKWVIRLLFAGVPALAFLTALALLLRFDLTAAGYARIRTELDRREAAE